MSKSKIAWTNETANWIVGCTKISAGCAHCYASTAANSARLQQFPQYKNVVDHKGNWNGNVEFVPKVLDDLLKGKKQRRVFAPSMSDPFHPAVKDEWLDQFMATVVVTPHITYQLLTKRPERMFSYFDEFDLRRLVPLVREANDKRGDLTHYRWKLPLPNLHLGVTVENQSAADERIPWLLETPATKRFLSIEPMLEQTFLDFIDDPTWRTNPDWHPGLPMGAMLGLKGISQVIIGGESGSNARPFHLEWARSMLHDCRHAGVSFFMKQMGSNPFMDGKPLKLKSRSGADISEWPQDLQVQEFII
jgi:protein gp37